jgi:5-oxoprolinase (ATP-hydrolysing)
MLEVFNNLFMSIAEQMGATLANTAYSVNIKERLDFSCALFDRTAGWWPTRRMCRCISARCPRAIRTVIRLNPDMKPGDVFVLNAPFNGGTHLPDVTVITPVFDEARRGSCSTSPRAATTPTSAARRPARRPPTRRGSRRRAC